MGAASKYCSYPSEAHLTAVKRILRYLKETVNLAMKYEKSENGILVGYSDADWAGDPNDHHSTTGNIFIISGGAVSWFNKKQAMVALYCRGRVCIFKCCHTRSSLAKEVTE